MSPAVSVVLCTYNGARFLGAQLASLARQTLPPAELVVCDDGSTDTTLEIVATFAHCAPFPVRTVANPVRLGYAGNFLSGVARCTGEFVAFCDQDDVWHDDKLRRCAAALAHHGAVLVLHRAEVVDADLHPLHRAKPDLTRTCALPRCGCELALTWPGFAMVFSAALLRDLDPARRPCDHLAPGHPRLAHDQWVAFLARAAGPVVLLADSLALYRQHAANVCGAAAPAPPAPTLAGDHRAYLHRAEAAAYYSKYLAALSRSAPGPLARTWRQSSDDYRRVADRYSTRARLHHPVRSWRPRLRAFAALLTDRAYIPRSRGGLGLRALVKDTVALLRLRPLATRSSPASRLSRSV